MQGVDEVDGRTWGAVRSAGGRRAVAFAQRIAGACIPLALGALLMWGFLYRHGDMLGEALMNLGMRTAQMGGATVQIDDTTFRSFIRLEIAKHVAEEARKPVQVQK